MTILWHIIKPETQAAIRRYMPPGWEPPTILRSKVHVEVKLETPEEIDKLMRLKPNKKEAESE
jgi:hypothetical protein